MGKLLEALRHAKLGQLDQATKARLVALDRHYTELVVFVADLHATTHALADAEHVPVELSSYGRKDSLGLQLLREATHAVAFRNGGRAGTGKAGSPCQGRKRL